MSQQFGKPLKPTRFTSGQEQPEEEQAARADQSAAQAQVSQAPVFPSPFAIQPDSVGEEVLASIEEQFSFDSTEQLSFKMKAVTVEVESDSTTILKRPSSTPSDPASLEVIEERADSVLEEDEGEFTVPRIAAVKPPVEENEKEKKAEPATSDPVVAEVEAPVLSESTLPLNKVAFVAEEAVLKTEAPQQLTLLADNK